MSNKIINLNLLHPEINGSIFNGVVVKKQSGGVNKKLHNYILLFFNWGTLRNLDV